MLKIIAGSAGTDLSGGIVREMVSLATGQPDKKFIIIVPEQYTLQTQKRAVALHPDHVCMNIDVVSFDRLAHVVLAKAGRDVAGLIDDVGKALILRSVLEKTASRLVVYKSKIRMPGFLEELKSLITELKQYGVDDNTLFLMTENAGNGALRSKIEDIRLIYGTFNEEIRGRYTTPEEVLDVFAQEIDSSDFIRDCDIFLDGFTGFTPIQYRLIGKMLTCAANVTCSITLPKDRINKNCREYDLFALSNETYFRLKELAADNGVPVAEDVFMEAPARKRTLYVSSSPNPAREAEDVAERVLRLVRKNGLRFRDIGILSSDLESYHKLIRNTFRLAGISAFIDYKEELAGNLLVRFLMAAMEIASKGLSYEPVFSFLKTGLLGTDPDETALLENYCLEYNIRGRRRWESDFAANRQLRGGGDAWNLEEINEIRKRVAPVITNLYDNLGGKTRKASIFCRVLTKLMEDCGVRERLEEMAALFEERGELSLCKQYEQIYAQIEELLGKIELLMGGEDVSAAEFARLLESGTGELRLGIIPPSIDALVVGDMTRTRLDKISHLFIIGANEGKLPAAKKSSGLFTQREREHLRKEFEIAPMVLEDLYTQRFYIHLALNKPKEALYISYGEAAPDGTEMLPSGIIDEIHELAGDLQKKEEIGNGRGLWRARAARLLADNIREYTEGRDDSIDTYLMGYFAAADPEAVRGIIAGACFSNVQAPLNEEVASGLYGRELKGSVSRFETFYECPYRHFLSYGIGLEQRREYKVEATDLGTVYHEALSRYSESIKEEGYTFRNISDDDSNRIITESVNLAIEEMESDVLKSSARNEFFKGRIVEISRKTVNVLREHVKAGEFEPARFEMPFRERLEGGVSFTGIIDRVDIYEAGDIFVKIIDYKSGQKKFSAGDIYSGIQLQLVAYMDSAMKEVAKGHKEKNVRPGGVYYYLISDKYIFDEDEAEKNMMSGLTSREEGVAGAIDGNLAEGNKHKSKIIPVSIDGDELKGDVREEAAFLNLIDFVKGRINEAGERIKQGDIAINPISLSSYEGCKYCDFADVCKFEPGKFGCDYRMEDTDKAQMEAELYG
ncbi:MAG: PD-(D/E)XK nuclease family protein [Lachnospiraceae bacterium]|jgi:ATP-dependent helicase/nuclease subunit B